MVGCRQGFSVQDHEDFSFTGKSSRGQSAGRSGERSGRLMTTIVTTRNNRLHRLSIWVTTPTNTTVEGLDKRQIDVHGIEKMALEDVHYIVIYLT